MFVRLSSYKRQNNPTNFDQSRFDTLTLILLRHFEMGF